MSDKDRRLTRDEMEYREQTDKPEKRGFRILYQVIALIVCLLISFTVWVTVHYREDKKDDPIACGREAYGEYSDVCSVL